MSDCSCHISPPCNGCSAKIECAKCGDISEACDCESCDGTLCSKCCDAVLSETE